MKKFPVISRALNRVTHGVSEIQKGTFAFSLNLSEIFHEMLIRNRKVFNELGVPSHALKSNG